MHLGSPGAMPWLVLAGYGLVLLVLSPRAGERAGFYQGRDRAGRPPGTALLFASLFISWIFAKSVTNAADLGATYGLPGAVAYAAYWLSIPVAGVVILRLRRRHGAGSLPGWVASRYGRAAGYAFLLAILIRLFNEVWSNTAVVGSYFGPKGSGAYYGAALGFTALTLAYTMKGGLRASMWTDALQAGVFGLFLALTLAVALPRATGGHLERVATAGSWTLAGGLDLLLVAVLQSLSYPFHDPVLTDRGFLSGPRATRIAFLLAGVLGAGCIVLFGSVGVTAYVSGLGVRDDAPRVVATALGSGVLLMVNVVMLTSAGSTLDSALSSVAKAAHVDAPALRNRRASGVGWGRAAMAAAAVLGSLPLLAGAAILKATTVSGTMVMGLAPAFVLGSFLEAPSISFHLAFWTGVALGVVEALGAVPAAARIGDGPFASLLGVNAWGLALVTALFLLPLAWRRGRDRPSRAASGPGLRSGGDGGGPKRGPGM